MTCHVSSAQLLLQERVHTKLTATPDTPQHDTTLHAEIRELRDLILAQAHEIGKLASKLDAPRENARQLEIHLNDMGTSVTGSITSTLSSASRSALTQCQSFLTSQKSMMSAFFSDHTAQLSSLYARSNSSDTRDTQLHNMMKTYAESISRREADVPRTDLLRVAVENNTLQVAQLMETLRSTIIPDNTAAITTLPVSLPSPTHGSPSDVPHDPISTTPAQDIVTHSISTKTFLSRCSRPRWIHTR